MALETHAFLMKAEVPGPEGWQRAIDGLGFGLTMDPELEPFEDSGFLPCQLGDRGSGFEIYYDEVPELVQAYPRIADLLGGRDACISFRWGGDMAECACVVIACAALVKSFGAVVYYPADDLVYDYPMLLKDAHAALAEL